MTDSETLKDISKQIADLLVKQSEIQDTILKAELSKNRYRYWLKIITRLFIAKVAKTMIVRNLCIFLNLGSLERYELKNVRTITGTKITQNGKNISNSTLCLIESNIHTPIAVMLINHKNPLLSLIAILYRVYIKYINTKGENTAANTAIESKKYPLGLPLASKPFR